MTVLTRRLSPEAARADGTWTARSDIVLEDHDGEGRFTLRRGPFYRYERTVTVQGNVVVESIDYELARGAGWPTPFALLVRRALRRRPRTMPWWAPAEPPDARATDVLGLLAALAVLAGYLGALLTETITFAADEFDASDTAQGAGLAAVRVGVLGALVLTALADRRGRRGVLTGGLAVAILMTALGAAAPNLATLAGTQLVSRGILTAVAVLLAVVAVEEMPSGARAYAVSLLAMAGGLGIGAALWLLPLADLAEWGWRLLYVVPLAALPLLRGAWRALPESRRFLAPHRDAPIGGHGRRFWMLGVSALLLNLFTAPASQFMNEFLRDERGFSAARITMFTILTNTPAFLGMVAGSRWADRHGRRPVGAVGVAGGATLTVAMVLAAGWPMWALSLAGGMVGALTVPALGVYGPELFPTSLRGRANAAVSILGVTGGAVGLLAAGRLSDLWDGLGPALALLCAGPLVMAVTVLVAYPETTHVELEQLNPEDAPVGPGAAPTSPPGPRSADPHPSGRGDRPRPRRG